MHDVLPEWQGIDVLVRAGFTDEQIKRCLFIRRYHYDHPEEEAKHGANDNRGHSLANRCGAVEALKKAGLADG